MTPLKRGASGDRNILARQSLIDRNRKVAAHLDPVFVPLRPRAKLKLTVADANGDRSLVSDLPNTRRPAMQQRRRYAAEASAG
jgi:hypothetical protein